MLNKSLDPANICLQLSAKTLKHADLLVGIGQLGLEQLEHAALAAQAGRVVAVERQHLADLFKRQTKLLERVDFFETAEV